MLSKIHNPGFFTGHEVTKNKLLYFLEIAAYIIPPVIDKFPELIQDWLNSGRIESLMEMFAKFLTEPLDLDEFLPNADSPISTTEVVYCIFDRLAQLANSILDIIKEFLGLPSWYLHFDAVEILNSTYFKPPPPLPPLFFCLVFNILQLQGSPEGVDVLYKFQRSHRPNDDLVY